MALPNKALQLTAGVRGVPPGQPVRRRIGGRTRRRRPDGGKVGHGRRQLSADPLGGGKEVSGRTDEVANYVHRVQGRGPNRAGAHRQSLLLEVGSDHLLQGSRVPEPQGRGFKSNYFDTKTGDQYWISGPRKDGADRLYGERVPVEIDSDVREEYWSRSVASQSGVPHPQHESRPVVLGMPPPNKRLQLTAAVCGVRRPWPAAVGPGAGPPPASGQALWRSSLCLRARWR